MADAFPSPEFLDEVRAVNVMLAQMPYPDPTTAEGMAALRATKFDPDILPEIKPIETMFPGPGGDLRARVIQPEGPLRAVMLNFHGGGFCLGDPADDDLSNDLTARRAQIAVVSTSYRLAPEHPFPAAYDDAVAATQWLLDHGPEHFGTDRMLIGGGSAGGWLAARILNWLKSEGHIDRVVAANLLFGIYDLGGTPSHLLAGEDVPVLPKRWLEGFMGNAFPHVSAEDKRTPHFSPLYADVSGMPPALFSVGELDPFLDDSLFLEARWREAGNQTQLDVWKECAHGYLNMYPHAGAEGRERIADWIAAQVDAAGL